MREVGDVTGISVTSIQNHLERGMKSSVEPSRSTAMPDLAHQIRKFIDSGAAPVTFEEVLERRNSGTLSSDTITSITEKWSARAGRRRWWMLAPTAAAALALAVVLVNVTGSPSEADALQLVRSSPNVALRTARSSHFVETVTGRYLGGATYGSASAVGSADASADTFEVLENVYGTGTAHHVLSLQLEYLSDGKNVYQSVPNAIVAPRYQPWIAYPVNSSGSEPASASPTASVLSDARGPVKDLGSKTIDGVTTKGYALTVSAASIVSHALPSERALEAQSFSDIKNVRVEVWLDGTGRPVADEFSWHSPALLSPAELRWVASERITYSNQPVAVTPPASEQVTFGSNAAQARALLGQKESNSL